MNAAPREPSSKTHLILESQIAIELITDLLGNDCLRNQIARIAQQRLVICSTRLEKDGAVSSLVARSPGVFSRYDPRESRQGPPRIQVSSHLGL
jgi:hypothetical protein